MAQTMETPSSTEDLTQRIPVDLLAHMLRRLQTMSPPSLAVSRCVCKAWRDVVDTRRLLVYLLPRSLSGIFAHIGGDRRGCELLTQYFSPSTNVAAAAFDYVDAECSTIKQHCNGLLLLNNEWPRRRGPIEEKAWVVNHATRRWTRLPPPPSMCTPGMEDVFIDEKFMHCHDQHLAFDPAVSPHYEVFLVKHVPELPWPDNLNYVDDHVKDREWPPSTFILFVFSSRTKRWEERPFIRQGEAAGIIGYMLEISPSKQCYGAYWRGTLYVHQHNFILRINMSNDTYQVIKLPKGFRKRYIGDHYLGKSENGVYCARLSPCDGLGLRIWHLDDVCDEINWRLKCDINLGPLLADFSYQHHNIIHSEQRCTLLGFHPNEETVLLHTPLERVMSYRFDSSEMEDLGCLPVEPQGSIYYSFPYTSCPMGEFLSKE